MAEASKGRVTITLGRTGQVVKRAATSSDVNLVDRLPGAGSKRSIRDRLGSNSDSFSSRGSLLDNKRQRGDSYMGSSNVNGAEDAHIDKHDLRHKLMLKNASRRVESNHDERNMDLRQKLSRTAQPPAPRYCTITTDTRQSMPDPRSASGLGRIPLTRSADNLPRMDSSRNSYSPWTLDHIRRSPDRVVGRSRGLSPPRSVEDLPRRPLSRTLDDSRTFPYMSNNVHDASRPVSSSTAFMAKPVMPSASAKPVPPLLGQLPPPGGIMQKSSYVVEEQQTVEGLLHSLGLGKYAILFKAEEVDMTALKQMGEHDLKELGIPMGPRKKILLALLPRSKRQP